MLEWIAEYYQVISVVFGTCAAVLVICRLGLIAIRSLIRFIEHEQRNKWQAEFFDRNHTEIKEYKQKSEREMKKLSDDIARLREDYAANNGRRLHD